MEQRNPAIIPSRIIPGCLTQQNQHAFHWGWQGLLACGSQKTVVVIDPGTVQVVQTLVRHRHPVCKVRWAKENYHHDVASPYSLRLASVDTSGRVIVWDVSRGTPRTEFSENGRTLSDLEWLSCQDASHDLLVAIHAPNILALWNADTGTKLWKKSYETVPHLHSLTLDPFEATRLAALGSDCILFINDFSISRQPASDGKKFFMSLDKVEKSTAPTRVNLTTMGRVALSGIRLLIGDEGSKGNEVSLMECRQLSHLPSLRHHLAAVFPKEILILDVNILQAVASIPLERNGSPFIQILPLRQRAGILCAHENGSLSLRLRRFCRLDEKTLVEENENPLHEAVSTKYDLNFDTTCHSDPFRVTNRIKPMAASVCPVSESTAAVLVSDGRIFIWKLSTTIKKEGATGGSSIYSPDFCLISNPNNQTLPGLLAPTQNILSKSNAKTDGLWGEPVLLRWVLKGLFSSLTSPVSCVRMCPALTRKNWPYYRPLLAVGLTSGNVQIFDLATGRLTYEFGVHTCEVRGIEWIGLKSFVSFAYPQTNSQGNNVSVINEVVATDLQSGRSVPFRTDRANESPIHLMKISSKKQYLLLVFYDKPMELWDVRTRSILRELGKSFPTIHAVEWAPPNIYPQRKHSDTAHQTNHEKEHLVLTDAAGTLYHCIAEGSSFKQGSKIPHTGDRNSTVTCITWKQDHIFMGDTDGVISVWNLKSKMARSVPTHRGWVKKVRFGPGKGNLSVVVLLDDGVEVWDADDVESISSVRTPKQLPKIIDLDWCSSDKLVLSCENGQIIVIDSTLTLPPANLPINEMFYWKPLHCPYLLPTKTALIMKAMLQHGILDTDKLVADTEVVKRLESAVSALPRDVIQLLRKGTTLARCSAVSKIYGDESEVHFWHVLSHYTKFKQNLSNGDTTSEELPSSITTDMDLDTLSDCSVFRLNELQRSMRHSMLRSTPLHTRRCIENLVLFGQVDKAIHLSLETEPTSSNYYQDCLKSCLLAALKHNPESAQSSVKLVATNLIANGQLREGVEILCMINKSLDACRYLASHGQWELAVWLAKVRLTGNEYEEIMIRWANHLCSPRVNNKSKAILVYLSLRKFSRVLETFYQMRYFDRAAMFAMICQEFDLLEEDPKLTSLIESIHYEYVRYLQMIGCGGELIDMHKSRCGDADKAEVNEEASDDTNSSESSVVVVPSPSSYSTSDEYEKLEIAPG